MNVICSSRLPDSQDGGGDPFRDNARYYVLAANPMKINSALQIVTLQHQINSVSVQVKRSPPQLVVFTASFTPTHRLRISEAHVD
jgi:hypothetical protein